MKIKHGFTLIELLLTIVVISASLLGIMALFENSTRGALQADVGAIAAGLAHEKLERIVSDKVYLGYGGITQALYPNETFTGDFSIYTRSTQIREVSSGDFTTSQTGSGYKRVDVTVYWGVQASQQVTVPTVISSY